MSDPGLELTQRAFALIEENKYEEARALLKNYLSTNRDNADAWWLYAHTVDDLDVAEAALRNVLRVDPNYAGAQSMLDELQMVQVEAERAGADEDLFDDRAPDFLSHVDDFDDDTEDDLDDFDDAEELAAGGNRRRRLLIGGVVVIGVVGLLAALLIIDSGRQQGGVEATQVADLPEPTVDTIILPPIDDEDLIDETPSFVVPEPEPEIEGGDTAGIFQALADSGLNFVPDSVEIVPTSKGQTLTVQVCSGARFSEIQQNLTASLVAIASQSPDVADTAQALGVRLVDCDASNSLLRFVVVDMSAAVAFANGELSEGAFAAQWDVE